MFSMLKLSTVQGKAILVVAFIFIVSCVMLIAAQGFSERSHALSLTVNDKKVETSLVASAMSAALRWQKDEVFEQTRERLVDRKSVV